MKILPSEITPYSTYINRRKFIKNTAAAAITLGITNKLQANHKNNGSIYSQFLDAEDKLNSFEEITTYNNFYEFGMGKTDPSENSGEFKPKPWTISLEGLINKPQVVDLEKLLHQVREMVWI